jgi:hypothetical protein
VRLDAGDAERHSLAASASCGIANCASIKQRDLAMDTLPSDITTVIQDFCDTRALGYGLGCSGKAWRPSDTTWKRHASRHPLTRLAVKWVSSDYARWCASLYTVQRPTATARRALTYSFDEEHGASVDPPLHCVLHGASVDPALHCVLQIWRGGALVAVETLEDSLELMSVVGRPWELMSVGRPVDFVVRTPFSEIKGVAMVPGESLRIDVVALPSVGQDFVPTLVYSAFITSRGVDDKIAHVRRTIEQEEPDDRFIKAQLLPSTSSPLFESDNRTCFNQIGATLLATGGQDNSDWYPNCYARIVRDTNGEMTGLHVNQFWWNFPAPCLQSIMLNRRG